MDLVLLEPVNYYKRLKIDGDAYYVSFTREFEDIAIALKPRKIFDAISTLIGVETNLEYIERIDPFNLSSLFERLYDENIYNTNLILDSITSLEFYHSDEEIIEFVKSLDSFAKKHSSKLIVLAFTKDNLYFKVKGLSDAPLSFNG
ncbi:MAG: hypothetical protein QXP36_11940 [Conexivisphaerales archaeon]